jgi:hypothetical protein
MTEPKDPKELDYFLTSRILELRRAISDEEVEAERWKGLSRKRGLLHSQRIQYLDQAEEAQREIVRLLGLVSDLETRRAKLRETDDHGV